MQLGEQQHGNAGKTKRSSWRGRKEPRLLVNCLGGVDSDTVRAGARETQNEEST